MNAAEIVKGEPASDSGPVVLPFFAEGIREARESAKAHTRAQNCCALRMLVQMRSGSGWPKTGTVSTEATSAGEYRAPPSLVARLLAWFQGDLGALATFEPMIALTVTSVTF